ncbi:MAG: acyl-ACP thioesterase domain-containing protein [Eubacteriaceae bacterium]
MFEIKRELGRSNVGVDSALTLGSAVDFMQDCSIFDIDSKKNLKDYLLSRKVEIYYASRQIDILRMPAYTENITIKTWIYECKRAFVNRNTVIYDKDNKACITSFSIGAFVDVASGKAILMPNEFISNVKIYDKYPMEYLDRRINIPNIKAVTAQPTSVLKYHLDFNNHVNNTKYISIAQEYLPLDFSFKQVRVEYKTPAKYKDTIYPFKYIKENAIIIDLCAENGASYATVEFMN